MVHLHPDVAWRRSKRGLVLASPACGSLLFEHPRSAALVDLLADDPDPSRLRAELGPPLPDDFVDVLLRLDVLTEGGTASADQRRPHGVEVTASGILLPGVGGPARWLARLVPGVSSRAGRVALGTVVVAGVAAMLAGRPDLPSVSAHPAIEALLMLFLTLLIAICHELAHAVALVHYGREPTRAGFGFYWGALCFYVDSTAALTLTRRQRVTQALVGLAVNVVALSVCAVAAHLCSSPLLAIVFWRVSVLGLVGVAVNLAPILEVDGHWALADLLDEPDLAPRARRSLALATARAATRGPLARGVRRRQPRRRSGPDRHLGLRVLADHGRPGAGTADRQRDRPADRALLRRPARSRGGRQCPRTAARDSLGAGTRRHAERSAVAGYLRGSYRIATAPESSSSRLTSLRSTGFDSPANKVGP